jgi:hypothetical protein
LTENNVKSHKFCPHKTASISNNGSDFPPSMCNPCADQNRRTSQNCNTRIYLRRDVVTTTALNNRSRNRRSSKARNAGERKSHAYADPSLVDIGGEARDCSRKDALDPCAKEAVDRREDDETSVVGYWDPAEQRDTATTAEQDLHVQTTQMLICQKVWD